MEFLVSLLTSKLLVPLVPVVVSFLRNYVLGILPAKWIPLALTLAGSIVGALESQLGLPVTDLSMAGAGAWEGALMGLAAVGVHQLYLKLKSLKEKQE